MSSWSRMRLCTLGVAAMDEGPGILEARTQLKIDSAGSAIPGRSSDQSLFEASRPLGQDLAGTAAGSPVVPCRSGSATVA